jgi:ABC-2 type transport system permease protein
MKTTGIKFWWLTCVNEAWFALVMMRRYLFDTVVGLIAVFLLFLVVFMGLRTFMGDGLTTDTLDAVIVGYIMWMFALLAYTGSANAIIDEAKQGTLEQLFMAPAGICRLLIVRMGAGVITAIVFNSVLLLLAMLSTDRWLQIPYGQSLLLIVLGLPAVQGLGFAIAGIALVHKRVEAVSSIMQFALIALVSLPAYPFNSMSLLPFTAAASGVNQLVTQQAELPLAWYGLIFVTSLFYLLLGVFIFKRFEAKAKSLNVLGHY